MKKAELPLIIVSPCVASYPINCFNRITIEGNPVTIQAWDSMTNSGTKIFAMDSLRPGIIYDRFFLVNGLTVGVKGEKPFKVIID